MCYSSRFVSVCGLGMVLLVGCSEGGGTAGSGGTGGSEVVCLDNVCPCTAAGIRGAIAEGGGPFTFDCDGPQTVVTDTTFNVDTDVILDGEDNLTVALSPPMASLERVFAFSVPTGVKAELRRLTMQQPRSTWEPETGGIMNEGTLTIRDCVIAGHESENAPPWEGGGILNAGDMSIINSTISENWHDNGDGGGIYNACDATLRLVNSTVSKNGAAGDGSGNFGGGIYNAGDMSIINSTVSENDVGSGFIGPAMGGGIVNVGWMSLINSTVFGNIADLGSAIAVESVDYCRDLYTEIANTLIDGDCDSTYGGSSPTWVSTGHNVESPGNTCSFDQPADQVNVSADDLKLGPRESNGGPTETHALLPGSVAIDQIPEADCLDADGDSLTTDQRGEPRDSMCDVGAFEVQP